MLRADTLTVAKSPSVQEIEAGYARRIVTVESPFGLNPVASMQMWERCIASPLARPIPIVR